MYSLLVVRALACMLPCDNALRRPGLATSAGFVSSGAFAYLTNYFTLKLPLVQLASLAANLRTWPRLLRLWAGLQLLASLPLLGWVYALSLRDVQIFGIEGIPVVPPTDLIETLLNFTVGDTAPLRLWQRLGLGVCLVFALLGLRTRWPEPAARLLAALREALTTGLTVLISVRRPIYVDHFLSLSVPAFLLLIAASIISLWGIDGSPAAGLGAGLFAFAAVRLCFWSGHTESNGRRQGPISAEPPRTKPSSYGRSRSSCRSAYATADHCRWRKMEVDRALTPLDDLAAGNRGTWLVYRNASLDAHRVASNPPFDPAAERDAAAAAWLAGQGPALLERADFEGVTVFHFGSMP